MRGRDLMFAALGVVTLLVVKYAFVGLRQWDAVLHPQRSEPTNSRFLDPFLGLFAKGCDGHCS